MMKTLSGMVPTIEVGSSLVESVFRVYTACQLSRKASSKHARARRLRDDAGGQAR